jgi:hypothetical protein
MGTLAIGDFTSESEDMFFDSSVITRIQQLVVTCMMDRCASKAKLVINMHSIDTYRFNNVH